jgi:hypothetical protein
MKKYLLPNCGKFYKANLHMHTNISDGKMTLEEVKKAYLEKGYSIVAFTDHEVMVPHKELTDESFLAITSTEVIVNQQGLPDFSYAKTYHLNLYSYDENKDWYNTFNKDTIWIKHSLDYVTSEQDQINYKRYYSIDSINDLIKKANEENCLVSYNHPVWSLQDYSDYIDLKGLWGVEWYNSECVSVGYRDSIKPIDDLLRRGERVFPLATDDAHNINSCFGGFVMVKADKLEYKTIFNSLKNGDFYSSTKPLIYDLWFEEGIVYIKTSNVKRIELITDRRITMIAKESDLVSEATFDISSLFLFKDNDIKKHYFRITIIDDEGNEANTRAYFLDELL